MKTMKRINVTQWIPLPILIASAIMVWVLCSCGPRAKLRHAEKLIAQAEAAGLQWHSDTLHSIVEIPVPEIVKDTIFQTKPGDTVYIHKDRLSVKYVRLKGDSIFIEGKCAADTVYKETVLTIHKEINAPPCDEQKIKWWYLIIALFVGGIIVKLLR